MIPNPHKLGVHKLLKHIPLNAIFDAPAKARLRKAVNIADLRLCAKQRAHKVSGFIVIMADKKFSIIAHCWSMMFQTVSLSITHRWCSTI